MSGPRRHTIMGLLLLMCALTEHVCESAPSTVPVVRGDARPDLRRMQHIMRHVEDNRGRHHSAKPEAPALTARAESSSAEQRDFRNKADKGNQSVVIFPRDLRKKEKFIKHITGPLFFSPKCRKMVYRVYHHTRDCTIRGWQEAHSARRGSGARKAENKAPEEKINTLEIKVPRTVKG